MLTEHQKEAFEAKGLLYLKDFLPRETVRPVQEFIYRLAAKEGAWKNGEWQLDATSDRPEFTKPISKAEFNSLMTPELMAVIGDLVDGQKVEGGERGGKPSLLFTLPQNGPWKMMNAWHTDASRLSHGGLPGVQMFTFLEPVRPRGGGTLVVAGSHRLVNYKKFMRSKDISKRLKKLPYFKALTSKEEPNPERFLTTPGKAKDVDLQEVELQVAELHGDPGDVYLMDMRMLHTVSTNTAATPRLMVTQRYLLESAMNEMWGSQK